MSFVHLHLHSHYSLLDSTIRIADLAAKLKEQGATAVALTDHGNMFAAVEFFKTMKKAGIKPIFGCEVYVADDITDPKNKRSFLLPLLAKDQIGYQNLIDLVSQGWLLGYDDGPRVSKAMLRERSEGLIALTGNLGGELPQALLRRDLAKAEAVITEYTGIFGRENLYLEILDNRIKEQAPVNAALAELSERFEVKLVATNDCHYLTRADAKAHGVLMCIQLGKILQSLEPLDHVLDSLYVKSPAEMTEAFKDFPEAVTTTIDIAERCNVELDLSQTYLPVFEVPAGFGLESYLRDRALAGLKRRFSEFELKNKRYDEDDYLERLNIELDIIIKMNFPGYFLIVWDFINFAKDANIPVGPGRGSGAGSLVAYSLRITDIDPLPYGLLFERFLNPERVSMPDFDIDFCMNKRQRVIDYVTDKYGKNNVGQIATFGSLKARGVLRDVGRTMGFSYGDVDRIAKLVPDVLNITLNEALDQEPKFKELFDENPAYQHLIEASLKLEGLYRHCGMHAAGLVISEEPLWRYVPVFRGANDEIVTQFAKNEVEEAGLVKFDFLGLKTLTVIDNAIVLINKLRRDDPLRIDGIAMDDPEVFKLLSSGDTTGVFQLESSGFKELMKKLRPDVFEDIIAAVALYRPGPLGTGMVDDFILRKHGQIAVEYPHPLLEDVLRETYGVIVYQEQVMRIASVMAGFSLGQADLLRRAMGKKKKEVMDQQREAFVAGAIANEIDETKAGDIFDLMAYFAGYGFNKSHSAAYALISYQTAYLKAHHPVEFMAALLTCDKDNSDKVVKFIGEAKAMSIPILPPDVNESEEEFSVTDQKIRFGLGAVKNVGGAAVVSIIENRRHGLYASLFDFCERVDLRKVNKRVLEQLVKCGAYDFTQEPRAMLFDNVEMAIERGQTAQRDRDSGQTNLFGMLTAKPETAIIKKPKTRPEWTDRLLLAYEKEAIGFYITAHPLDRYGSEIDRYITCEIAELGRYSHNTQVTIAGALVSMRERPLKSGKGRMAFCQFEDRSGQIEVIVFSRAFAEHGDMLTSGEDSLLVTGRVVHEGDDVVKTTKIRAESFQSIINMRRQRKRDIPVHLDGEVLTDAEILALKGLVHDFPGDCGIRLHLRFRDSKEAIIKLAATVDPSDDWLHLMRLRFGKTSTRL